MAANFYFKKWRHFDVNVIKLWIFQFIRNMGYRRTNPTSIKKDVD